MIEHTIEPVFNWPAGHRAALCPVILFDAPTTGSPNHPTIGIDYAPSGFDRLLTVFADLDVSATVGVTPAAERFSPTLVAKAVGMNLEVAGWSHEGDGSANTPNFKETSTADPVGYIVGLPHHPATALSTESGSWIIDGSGGDRPSARGETCLIPTSPYWVDSAWLDAGRPLPPSSLLETWSLSLAEVRTHGALMTVILHAELSGRLGISSQILRFLDEVIESGDVWIANARQIADWWRQESLFRSDD
jgi:hypothetical protein